MFLKVRLNLSTTDDFISELLVEYSLIIFSFNKSCTCLLYNSLPRSVHKNFGDLSLKIFCKAFFTLILFLSFKGITQLYFENISIHVNKYRYPLFNLANFCISTRSAAKISSI